MMSLLLQSMPLPFALWLRCLERGMWSWDKATSDRAFGSDLDVVAIGISVNGLAGE
uniref:Uncharacterized protein n=1 Tax=Rhizophora mucronata TaxID=61149 RepID=A0A2P2IHK1_RHIMU